MGKRKTVDVNIPNPQEVRTTGERFGPTKPGKRANIVGTCPANEGEFDENFAHKIPSKGEKD